MSGPVVARTVASWARGPLLFCLKNSFPTFKSWACRHGYPSNLWTRRLCSSSEDKSVLLIGMFTAFRGIMRTARVRDEFVPQEFKVRAGPGNSLTLMHQTLFPTEHISLLLQHVLASGSKNTQPPSRAVNEPTGIWRWHRSTDAASWVGDISVTPAGIVGCGKDLQRLWVNTGWPAGGGRKEGPSAKRTIAMEPQKGPSPVMQKPSHQPTQFHLFPPLSYNTNASPFPPPNPPTPSFLNISTKGTAK